MSAARRLSAATASLLGLAVLLVGVPLALGALVGWPLPHSWPSWTQVRTLLETSGIPDVVLIDSLAVVCWIAWLEFAVATVVEIVSAVAGYPAPRLRIVRPWQPLVARLVTMIILAMPLLGTRSQGAPTLHQAPLAVALSDRHRAITGTARATAVLDGQPAPTPTDRQALSRSPATSEYVVRGGDTLWGIATRDLRDPRQWPKIWRNNSGRAEPGQRRFTDPNLIFPGWKLAIPENASSTSLVPPATQPSIGPPSTSSTPPSTPAGETGGVPTNRPAPSPGPPQRGAAPAASAGSGQPRHGAQPAVTNKQPALITLPSGGMVGLSLATAIAAAIAAARLHERRRSRIGDREPSTVDQLVTPDLVRLTRVATRAVAEATSDDDEVRSGLSPATLLNALRARACAPGEIPIGLTADDRDQVMVETAALSGMALVGSGAERAARALLVSAVADHRSWRSEVLLTPTVAGLVNVLPTLINAQVVGSVGAALDLLEEELVRRGRALTLRGTEDYRATLSAADPMDTLLAVLDGAALGIAEAARIDIVVRLGRRLGVAVLVIGAAAGLTTLEIGEDGLVASPAPGPLGAARRWFVLSDAEASELLVVVAAGQGEPVERVESREPGAVLPPAATAEEQPVLSAVPDTAAPEPAVQLRVFGPPRVEVLGAEVMTGLRTRGRELLALLVARRDGLRQEELIDTLWPDDDADFDRSREQLTTAVTSTRRRLRTLTADRRADYILFSGDDRYRLDPAAVDSDLWRFEAALQDAARAPSDAERLDALERAVSAASAEPFSGAIYPWAEAIREHLRRRAVDAACELAELYQAAGQTGHALAALETARSIDPCREEVYQRLIALQIQLDRVDAAHRAFGELARELEDLGAAPSGKTVALLRAATPGPDDDDEFDAQEITGYSAVAMRRVVTRSGDSGGRPRARPAVARTQAQEVLPILDDVDGDQ
jgi:DNA-binding SARP family transcriptional activator